MWAACILLLWGCCSYCTLLGRVIARLCEAPAKVQGWLDFHQDMPIDTSRLDGEFQNCTLLAGICKVRLRSQKWLWPVTQSPGSVPPGSYSLAGASPLVSRSPSSVTLCFSVWDICTALGIEGVCTRPFEGLPFPVVPCFSWVLSVGLGGSSLLSRI